MWWRRSLVVVLAFLLNNFAHLSSQECEVQEALVDGSRYRLAEWQFSAYPSNEPHEARLSGQGWCFLSSQESQLWLQVMFLSEVIIERIVMGGHDGLLTDYYVSELTLQIGNNSGDLQTVLQNREMEPSVFVREESPEVLELNINSTLRTQVLRLLPLSWSGDEACIRFEVYGCPSRPVCSSDSIRSVSTNMSLLPPSSISASSETSDDPVQHLVTRSGNSWCSVESFDSPPSATLSFTHPVALVNMSARGGIAGFSYVTNFSVEVFNQTIGQFVTYSFSGDRIDFTTKSAGSKMYTFWQPLVGQSIRFVIQDGERHFYNDDFCWSIELFGCLKMEESDAVTLTSSIHLVHPTSPSSPVSSPTFFPTNTSSPKTAELTTVAAVVAVITVLVLLVLVLLPVLVCLIRFKKSKRSNDSIVYSGDDGRVVVNTLYRHTTPSAMTDGIEIIYDDSTNKKRLSEEVPSSQSQAVDQYEEIKCNAEAAANGEDRHTPHYLHTASTAGEANVLSSQEQALNAVDAPASQPCGSMTDNPLYGVP